MEASLRSIHGRENRVVAGFFDPITKGHVWLVKKALHVAESARVAVGVNPAKKGCFSPVKRKFLIEYPLKEELGEKDWARVEVDILEGQLLINCAIKHGAKWIFRGLRSVEDFNCEAQMLLINRKLDASVEIVFLMPPRQYAEVSSSAVKGLVGFEGWEKIVGSYVSAPVIKAFEAKLEKIKARQEKERAEGR